MADHGLDIAAIRALYPALDTGAAYLDGAAGTQVPTSVIDAIADAYRGGIGNVHGTFAASRRSDAIVTEARQAVADLVGGVPDGVFLGPNMTTLTYRLARALSRTWREGDEIVVSRLDHDANIRPWVQAAADTGVTVRWAEVDLPAGELPAEQYDDLLTDRTRLVSLPAASNVIGTRPDVAAITAKAHAAGALTFVDGVHSTPHTPVDVRDLGADFYATSAYKWCGPHIGAVIADPAQLDKLRPDKLVPSPDTVPDRFETGTSPFADLAGVTAAVNHLAALTKSTGSRRERILASMTAAEQYEQELLHTLLEGLQKVPGITLHGRPERRTATVYFSLDGHAPDDVAAALGDRDVNVWSGHMYAWELAGALGVRDGGGAVRAGLVHYNDASDVERLLVGLSEL